MARWYFDTYRPQDKRHDYIQGEFFSSETISDPGRALVREGIQNSLDAAIGTEPVLVRIFVSGKENAIKPDEVNRFFNGGWPHFRAAPQNGLMDLPAKDDACEFLVFEDFNTRGLTGSVSDAPRGRDSKNAFAHFFRADGISDKGVGDRGSWGVGKTVFQRSSRLNTMFGLTVRHDDHRALLMGMSMLKGHCLDNIDYKPDGLFGLQNDDGMVMPLEKSEAINGFCKCFSLERGSEPGLSIVVPWLDTDVTEDAIVRAVMRDYFYPILTNRLEVIVKTPSSEITVTSSTLEDEVKKLGQEIQLDLGPLIELARWSLGQDSSTTPKLESPDSRKAMEWNDALFPENLKPLLTKQLMSNERLAVRVPVNVREKNKAVQESYFDVFLVRDGSDRSDRPVFVRDGLIITDVNAQRSRGLTSLVIVKDRPLAAFLGDSENPSHTQWQHDGSHFKGKYKSGPADLRFVKDSVRHLVRLLTESESEEDRNLLADIFNLPDGELLEKKDGKDSKGDATGKPDVPPPGKRIFNISRLPGGFVVTAARTAGSADIPPCAEILAAYDVRRGNAFNRYIAEDFRFDGADFQIDLEGAMLLSRSGNRITAKLDTSDFRISVTGFDVNRDVRVKVAAEENGDADPIV